MVDELRGAIERAQQLTDSAQRELAAQIEVWLDEQEWKETVNSQEGRESLAQLISEAVARLARGEADEDEGGSE